MERTQTGVRCKNIRMLVFVCVVSLSACGGPPSSSDANNPKLHGEDDHQTKELEYSDQLRKRAEQGDADAQNRLGGCYEIGAGVAVDAAEAMNWYRKAAEQGLAKAQFNLARKIYSELMEYSLDNMFNGDGEKVFRELTEAIPWCRKAAEKGLAEAQCLLGDLLEAHRLASFHEDVMDGNGGELTGSEEPTDDDPTNYEVDEVYVEAAKWYRKAAEQGYARAQFNLGMAYFAGSGVPQNTDTAMTWVRKAAEQEFVPALHSLGDLHRTGVHAPQDAAEAMRWYRKAADLGSALAQVQLGGDYLSGNGVPKDAAEALKWYGKAAEQGYGQAQIILAAIYRRGDVYGIPKDTAEAVKWNRIQAEEGDLEAQSYLAGVYAEGDGVPQDYVESYRWFLTARGARKAIVDLEDKMTPEQIAEGKRRADQQITKEIADGHRSSRLDEQFGLFTYQVWGKIPPPGEIAITDYPEDAIGGVEIPAEIDGKPVTVIAAGAFNRIRGLTSITIPDSVRSIGYRAFSGCSGLTSVTIPGSVKNIAERAFAGCTGLTKVTMVHGAGINGLAKDAFPSGAEVVRQEAKANR